MAKGGAVLLCLALGAGCGDDALAPDASTADAAIDAPACLPRATIPLAITAGAFPPVGDHPNVIVVVPQGYTAAAPTELVVYIHGFSNCIENIVGDTNQPCTQGGAVRNAYQLAAQLEASGRNALLVCPEVAFDMASGDPGQLGTPDGFRALLAETLAALPAPLGPLDLARHGRIVVASHSGGYQAASAILAFGGVPVDEVWLLDSLYGYTARFDTWVMQDLASFHAPARRFADIYTSGGGTLANSQAMASRAAMWVAADPTPLVDDRTTATISDTDLAKGLVFKLSGLSHDDVPRTYVERLLVTSGLSPRTCN